MMQNPSRLRRYRFGLWAEFLAVLLLRFKGYRILHRRLRTPLGEIDIIARRRDVLAVVEVKASVRQGDAAHEALGPRQRERLTRAANWFLASYRGSENYTLRFDFIAVQRPAKAPWLLWPRHYPDAWRADGM